MPTRTVFERVAFSPGEFAKLFGKSQTWGYRQIYVGKVTTITEHGRILIPASEVERILGTADRYNGLKKKPARTKRDFEAMKPELRRAWSEFLRIRRTGEGRTDGKNRHVPKTAASRPRSRREVLRRLSGTGHKPR